MAAIPPPGIAMIPLADLHFDPANPRFAEGRSEKRSESQILDLIAEDHEIEGLISSIAANGFLPTEPLVGVRDSKGVRVVEGNRRLAACLILSNDPRSKNQGSLRKLVQPGLFCQLEAVPAIVYPKEAKPKQLLPYLGVKHLVGALKWDSFAKAAWIADTVEEHKEELDLKQLEAMIGDRKGTLRRMLAGYYLVQQVRDAGKFRPEDSFHKGRGSSKEFPFSWVYNALGWKAVKDWLGLDDVEPRPKPVAADKLDNAEKLFRFMFGNRATGFKPSMDESRQLKPLADCLDDPDAIRGLERGYSVAQVTRARRSTEGKLDDAVFGLGEAVNELQQAVGELTEGDADLVRTVEPRVGQLTGQLAEVHELLLAKLKRGGKARVK